MCTICPLDDQSRNDVVYWHDRNLKLNPVETLEKVRSEGNPASHKWRSCASVEVGVMTHRSGRYRPKDILSKGRFT